MNIPLCSVYSSSCNYLHFQRKNQDSENDVYDDPTEWFSVNVNKPATSSEAVGLSMQTADLGVSFQPPHTNSLLNTRTNRNSGLTDSGNYSNRSSDASLGMQSTAGFLEGKSCSRPSGSHYEDYEDLDISAHEDSGSEHLPVLYKSENEQYPPKGTTDEFPGAITLQQVESQYTSAISTEGDLEPVDCVKGACLQQVSLDYDPTKLKQVLSDTERLSLLSDECSGPYYDKDLVQPISRQTTGCAPDSLSSELDFLNTFRPLQRRIQSVTRHLTECLCASSHPVKLSQTSPFRLNGSLLARQVVRQFSEDLAHLSKLCRVIVLISKDSPDPGLVRKFCTVQKTLDHTIPQLDRILEELSTPETQSHLEKPQLLSKMERLLTQIAQCMSVLETTVLTNINLLFSPVKLTDPVLQNQPDSKVKAFAHAAVDILSSPLTAPPSSWSLNHTEYYSCNKISYGSQSRMSELVKLIPVKRFLELQSQCEHAWSSSQCFLGRILPAKTGPPSSKTSSDPLTPKTVNTLVNATLDSCTQLIKSVSSFCALLSTLVDTFTDKTEILALQNELTTKNDSLCEALKGIITQAKEVCSHLQKEKEGSPLPGPVLQRLIGAGHTVCLCVKSIESCVSQYHDRTQTA
ncbi:hypothetical protein CRM22_005881 [Opisthorchis felineus]|uniref:Uncharacterized protein n=1 Tax=Opisthorchis felineus TaxID=147828 RepID=A0A4S2LNW1_OPIFE|nr:hypothetical protein CRM22_005881 [Opisthorchis felineus]